MRSCKLCNETMEGNFAYEFHKYCPYKYEIHLKNNEIYTEMFIVETYNKRYSINNYYDLEKCSLMIQKKIV